MTKELAILLIGTIVSLLLSGFALSQEKARPEKPAETKKPKAAKAEAVKKEPAPKPVQYRIGGIVRNIDGASRKITIEQDAVWGERKLTLTIAKKIAQTLEDIKVGQAVNAWVTDSTVMALTKVF